METHTFNAWEDGTTLNLEHFITQTGWLSQFPDINNPRAQEKPPFAQRWTIDLNSSDDGIAIVAQGADRGAVEQHAAARSGDREDDPDRCGNRIRTGQTAAERHCARKRV